MNQSARDHDSSVTLRPATLDDIPLLARMNRQLIEDEGSRNPMVEAALAERMRDWLAGAYSAVLFMRGNAIAGYAVYQVRHDEYYPEQRYVYLRQLYVLREARRQGVGRAAFGLLREECFPPHVPVMLDVLEHNATGRAFWVALGFRPYVTTMLLP